MEAYYKSNEFLCDVASDYTQVIAEAGCPEDMISWEDYVAQRIRQDKQRIKREKESQLSIDWGQ